MASKAYQGATFAIVSTVPPASNSRLYQGAVFAIVRPFEVVRVIKEYPITRYTPICGCAPVPFFTYEGRKT